MPVASTCCADVFAWKCETRSSSLQKAQLGSFFPKKSKGLISKGPHMLSTYKTLLRKMQ